MSDASKQFDFGAGFFHHLAVNRFSHRLPRFNMTAGHLPATSWPVDESKKHILAVKRESEAGRHEVGSWRLVVENRGDAILGYAPNIF